MGGSEVLELSSYKCSNPGTGTSANANHAEQPLNLDLWW